MMFQRTGQRVEEEHRGARIVAKSLFRELKTNGYTFTDVLIVAATLVGLVTDARREKEL